METKNNELINEVTRLTGVIALIKNVCWPEPTILEPWGTTEYPKPITSSPGFNASQKLRRIEKILLNTEKAPTSNKL